MLRWVFLVLVVVTLVACKCYAQPTTEITMYTDGSARVVQVVEVEVPSIVEVRLVGSPLYLLVTSGKGEPLSFNITGNVLAVEVIGEEEVVVTYDVEGLAVEEEGIWRLSIPEIGGRIDVTLPNGTVLLGFEPPPVFVESTDGGLKLGFEGGPVTLEYSIIPEEEEEGAGIPVLGLTLGAVAVIAVIVALLLIRRRARAIPLTEEEEAIIKFLKSRKGEAYQSEIRDYLGLPTTTVWRRVKRLESLGLVKVEKTPRGNLVKLKK